MMRKNPALIYTAVMGILIFAFSLFNAEAKPVFDSEQAFKYLLKQCDFGPRPPGSEAHEKTCKYLISELKKSSREVVTQEFIGKTTHKNLDLTNIIAHFGKDSDHKILLAAHWDTRPYADRDPDPENRDKPIIGANDGASGVAILLELARIFHKHPPDIQIIMVLFDGEDYGMITEDMFIGSRYFARNLKDEWRPDYGILIDMVGDKELDIYKEPYSYRFAPDIVEKVWSLAEKLNLDGIYHELGPPVLDDHIPLIEEGIKCIDIIDFNYPYWHSLEDTPDKCSAESLGIIGKLLVELVYSENH
ncbi:M28 family peptidase [Candidatus Poribacteria bacterium]|nr:M28 family peptidase [Candidatus Poribacteria bacterium]